MNKKLLICLTTFGLLLIFSSVSYGQWVIGAGYQYRQSNPSRGTEIQVQHYFKTSESKISIFARAHGGYFFNEKNQNVQMDFESVDEVKSYNFGLSGGLELQFGPVRPYAGIGASYERLWGKRKSAGFENSSTTSSVNANSHYLLPYLGVRVDIGKRISPLYRISKTSIFQ